MINLDFVATCALVTIKMFMAKLMVCLLQSFIIETKFTTKQYSDTKVYSYEEISTVSDVKSHLECSARCLNVQDCWGFKHNKSVCTLASEVTPILEDDATKVEDLFVDQEFIKDYENYGIKSSKIRTMKIQYKFNRVSFADTVLMLRGRERENSYFLNLETREICNLDIETTTGPWSPTFHINLQVGILANTFAVFCGGTLKPSDELLETCTFWGHETKANVTIPARISPAIVSWDFGSVWITGGYDPAKPGPTQNSFITSLENVKAGPDLPLENHEHCMVRLDDSTYAMIGGHEAANQLHFYHKESGFWTTGPSSLFSHLERFACTVFELQGSKAIAVVGGKDTNNAFSKHVEFFKMDTQTWEVGPALDEGVIELALVTGQNGKILYTIGGNPSNGAVRVLDCSLGTCPGSWTRYGGVVTINGNPGFVAGGYVSVPDNMMSQKCVPEQ